MTVSVTSAGHITTARLAGEVDSYTVPAIRAAFNEMSVQPNSGVVVDLREVTFLDSSGLGALIGLHHRVNEAGGHLQLVCSGVTLRLMELMNLGQVLDISTEPGVSPNGGAALA